MTWITSAAALLQLIPAIITALKAIEEAVPGQGLGEQKLAALRAILEGVSKQVSELWPAIQTAISVLVALFNATGVFKKAS